MKRIKRIISGLAVISLAVTMSGCDIVDRIKQRITDDNIESAGIENNTEPTVSNSISVGILDFDTFNPLLTQSETVKECMQFVYEPLFDVNESLQPVPVLAQDYTVSPDGRTININIRSDVLWQDGSNFTAYDAAYTIKQIRSGITTYTDSLANVADYKATGDYSLQIVLNYAVPNFVSLLTFPIVQFQSDMKMNPDYIPVGTGAYLYGRKISTGKLQFDAFDACHNGRPQIDNMYVYTVPDLQKYESMFEASEIDLMTGKTVELSEYTPRGSVRNNDYITNKLTFVGYNIQNKLLWGANTRKGLTKLIDKDSIVNSTIYSRGVAVDLPINPSSIFYYDTNTKFKKDELLAVEFFGNDNWGVNGDGDYVRSVNGEKQTLEFEILTNSDSSEKVNIATKIAESFTAFGIPTKVESLPYDEYMAKLNAKDYEIMVGEIEISPNLDLTPLVSSADNYFSYYNPDLDTLTGQMGMTHDVEQLKELFRQYGSKLLDDMPFTPLFFRKGDVLSSSKIKTEILPSVTREYRNVEAWSVKE